MFYLVKSCGLRSSVSTPVLALAMTSTFRLFCAFYQRIVWRATQDRPTTAWIVYVDSLEVQSEETLLIVIKLRWHDPRARMRIDMERHLLLVHCKMPRP